MNAPVMKPSEALRKARELITPEGAWIQHQLAMSAEGKPLAGHEPGAVCFCARGAMQKVWDDWHWDPPGSEYLMKVMEQDIGRWNNKHTHAEVLDAFDKAIALAEEAGQ